MSGGKRWAYAGAIVGGVVSVAANITHSFVPSQRAGVDDDTWRTLASAHPQPGAVMLAAFWPCALLLAIEVLARVDWPTDRRWAVTRWIGVTPVGIVAAIVSYRHLSGLLRWYAEDGVTVALGPLAVDGLMVISTGALLALAGRTVVQATTERTDDVPSTDDRAIGRTDDPAAIDERPDESSTVERTDDRADEVEPSGSSVVAIGSGRRRTSSRPARADDVAKLRAAIKDGRVEHPMTIEGARKVLGVHREYAKAALAEISTEETGT